MLLTSTCTPSDHESVLFIYADTGCWGWVPPPWSTSTVTIDVRGPDDYTCDCDDCSAEDQ